MLHIRVDVFKKVPYGYDKNVVRKELVSTFVMTAGTIEYANLVLKELYHPASEFHAEVVSTLGPWSSQAVSDL